MKRRYIVSITLLILLMIFITNIIYKVNFFETYMEELVINEVDFNKFDDGVYRGQADGKVIHVLVDVTIKDGRIEDIELVKHQNGQGDGANIILKDIIEAQSIEVDNITGATLSSKVIKKAIESALMD